MFRYALVLAFAFLAMAAGAATGAFGSIQDFARAVALKPGRWHTSAKVIEARIEPRPGADPAAVAALKARIEPRIGTIDEMNVCVKRAPKGAPRLPGILLEDKCSFSRMEAGEGRWTVASSCSFGSGQGIANTIAEGTYSRDKVTGRHDGEVLVEGAVVHIKAETVSRFAGKCRPEPPVVLVPAPAKD